jgi:hypothetical protein
MSENSIEEVVAKFRSSEDQNQNFETIKFDFESKCQELKEKNEKLKEE